MDNKIYLKVIFKVYMTERPRSITQASVPRKPLITVLTPKKKQSKNFSQPIKQHETSPLQVIKQKQSYDLKKKKFLRVFSSQQDFHEEQKLQNDSNSNNIDIMLSLRKYLDQKIKNSNESTQPSHNPTDTPIQKLYIFEQLNNEQKQNQVIQKYGNFKMQKNQTQRNVSPNRIQLTIATMPTKITQRKNRCKIFPITRRQSIQKVNITSTPSNATNLHMKMLTERDATGDQGMKSKIHVFSNEKIKKNNFIF